MNKTAIKNFAVEARNMLRDSAISQAGLYGITEDGCAEPVQTGNGFEVYKTIAGTDNRIFGDTIKKRSNLVKAIDQKGFDNVIEEAAYTWFNRLIAIRFMEVNDYLPTRVRVLSSETSDKKEPDIVTQSLDVDLNMSEEELTEVQKAKDENRYDDAFAMLFIKQCNELNDILPGLFEKTDDYMELLLKLSYTNDGVVRMLVDNVLEEDFDVSKEGQVEIIGWMYQYYNEERRNEVINIYKGTIKKEDIPAATQLFTTDWVVRYMVDNSLGRYWIERNPQSKLQEKLEYFVTPKNGQIQYINEKVVPEKLTFLDPCMGSGHILVYAFDIFMEIYRESGYIDRDAAQAIIENNLFGLDIDNRAYQLAYFAVMMKARSYDRRFFTREIEPNVYSILETNNITKFTCDGVTNDEEKNKIGEYLISAYKHAKEIGSLLTVENYDYKSFIEYLKSCNLLGQITTDSNYWYKETMPIMKRLAKQALIMSQKYTVVCTNPPYMNKLEGQLKKFIIKKYKPYSGDLFSVFMYRNFDYCKLDGYSGFMTPLVWMFIKTYEELRKYIIGEKSIITLVQMEYSAFEEATVPICSFVLKNGKEILDGLYFKLSNFKGGMEVQNQKVLEALENKDCGYFYETNKENFMKIPGMPVAYWVSKIGSDAYIKYELLDKFAVTKQGFKTGNNELFLRLWFEIDKSSFSICSKKAKWFPCNKGGAYRKWFGNYEYVVNWENEGFEIINYRDANGKQLSRPQNLSYNFKEGLTWSSISSGPISLRYSGKEMMFESKGSGCFPKDGVSLYSLQGFLNSNVGMYYIGALAPTLDYSEGSLLKLPYYGCCNLTVDKIVQKCITISIYDWDSFEISWNFSKHPLMSSCSTIEEAYSMWDAECDDRFAQLKANEEELNRIFIDIYDLQDELSPEVENKDITVRKADLRRDIKSFISYAVGCMFGRYSLDVEGLAYAGGKWDDSKYKTFIPDIDNIIPITDEEYFDDDILCRFVDFVKVVYREDTLEENLGFIADVLGGKGKSSREIIRNYFIKDFYKDHCKIYKKRPIYWLFDSGKQNGFKALIYMHRYDKDTVGRIRTNYLHKTQNAIEGALKNAEYIISSSTSAVDKAKATKDRDKYIKQLNEIKIYDQALAHVALKRIDIDLDDGVKHNYQLFQGVEISSEGEGSKKKKINLLAKI
ncbi:BREX-1 system adenine-specific DNA-methyltransferase PglX [Clostridium tyrobutyricum]|uniref:BREX-1 system adenine-specific DNA-methyltransferase PglX n=1 Tax=Clostridium tyrobutyricum TaxID=1519 RepID=UPI0011CAB563|nr:BREX-1 system adenine-specific DNA-methyltransferase PglX [Clostridium tyrobutyricum]